MDARKQPRSILRGLGAFAFATALLFALVVPANAEDVFRAMPSLARSIGAVSSLMRSPVPKGVPISIGLPAHQSRPDAFKLPASTSHVRAGFDPFTNRPIPMQLN